MFNREKFIKSATDQGSTPEEINNFLSSKGYPEMDKVEKAIHFIPKVMGAAGGLGGLALGNVPGAYLGGFAGIGAGRAVEDSLLSLLGYRTESGKDGINRVMDTGVEAVSAGGKNIAYHLLPKILSKIIHPIKSISKLRNLTATTEVGANDLNKIEELAQSLPTSSYQQGVPEEVTRLWGTLKQRLAPLQLNTTGQTGNMMLSSKPFTAGNVYEELMNLKTGTGAYKGSGITKIAGETLDRATREYMANQNLAGLGTQGLNKVLQTLIKANKFKNVVGKSVPWIVGGALLRDPVKDVVGYLKGQ